MRNCLPDEGRPLDYMMLDPVMNHADTYTKLFGHLLDGQFLFFLELRRRNFITPTDPVNRLCRKGESLRSTAAFSIKLISNFCLRQTARQLAKFGRPPRKDIENGLQLSAGVAPRDRCKRRSANGCERRAVSARSIC